MWEKAKAATRLLDEYISPGIRAGVREQKHAVEMTIGGKPGAGFPPILEIAGAIPTFPPHGPDSLT